MLTFLRKIRKSLVETGPTSTKATVGKATRWTGPSGHARKYILYAIGEIALVVIGILIALQINNWNEWRKERIIEKELLVELQETIKNNHDNLKGGLRSWQTTTNAIKVITHAMDNNLPYMDSLSRHYLEAHRSRGNNLNALNFAGYKALENKGYEILRNKLLRKDIVKMFEQSLPGLASTNAQVDFGNSGFHSEYFARNFTINGDVEFPHDYNKVMKDQYYYSILKRLDFNLNRKISRVQRTLIPIERLLKSLELELEKQ